MHISMARKKFKIKVPKSTHWYFTIIVKKLNNNNNNKKKNKNTKATSPNSIKRQEKITLLFCF